MKRVWVFLFLLVFFSTAALAADAPTRHKVLLDFEKQGGKVDFMGHAHGLDGWLITNDKGNQYVYTTPEGGMVIGMMFDPAGTLLTDKQAVAAKARLSGDQSALPGAEQSSIDNAEKLYAEVEKSTWALAGRKEAPYIYMFMNVNCDHCQAMWKDLQPAVDAGQVQVRLIPFGQQLENVEGGAALLSVDDPAVAWTKYIQGDKTVLGKDKILNDMRRAVEANTQLAAKWRLAGTPFTLYRKTSDGVVTAVAGKSENVMLILADVMKR